MAYHPFRNLGLKALAIGVSLMLWLTVAGEHVVERSLRVPLEFRNVPASLEIVGEPPSAVDVRLRGPSGLLGRLQPGDVVAVLDLNGARPGSRLFHLRTDQVRAPFGVTVSQVSPATAALAFEQSGSRVVPVRPDIEGEPAPGYVRGRVTAEPATVEVIGPMTDLKALREAVTEPIEIDGATETIKDTVTVGVADSALRLRNPVTAAVTIEILQAPIERTFGDVPVSLRNLPGGVTASAAPSRVTVAVRGGRDALAGLNATDLSAYVDLAGLRPGRYNLPVRIEPSSVFGVSRIEPAVVEVRIR